MYAVIETGGKQYLVRSGDTITVERLPGAVGEAVTFDKVLLHADDENDAAKIGAPFLSGVSVTGVITVQRRARKIRVVKFKRKVRYTRTHGHRQYETKVKIA